jgi:hypothetical protein
VPIEEEDSLEVRTDLACLTSSLRESRQSWETSVYTVHYHYSIRHNHCFDLQGFQLKIMCLGVLLRVMCHVVIAVKLKHVFPLAPDLRVTRIYRLV